jgi:hypothetical protein
MRVGAVFEEINRVGDDLEAREAFGQARVAVEEMPELVESRLDFLVASLEERVDRKADVLADLRRHLGHGETSRRALLEPRRSLAVRLVAPPGVEIGRHDLSIGGGGSSPIPRA